MLFRDRLEVWNPGTLPPTLTLAKLRRPHSSVPGNPLIAEALYLTKYIECMGTGTRDMIRDCKKAGLHEPKFSLTDGFVTTIYRKPGRALEAVTEESGVEKSREKGKEKSKEKVLGVIAGNSNITTRELADTVGLSISGVEKVIWILKKHKQLKRIGPDKGGHWEVSKT
jgi:predicted HTH transcriptional regulator